MDKMLDNDLNGPSETVVGPSVKIQGDLNSEGNIKIEGQVTGKVKTSQSVFVIPGAKIAADILAGNAIVGGELQGNIKIAGHLILQSTAIILGDISCSVLRYAGSKIVPLVFSTTIRTVLPRPLKSSACFR